MARFRWDVEDLVGVAEVAEALNHPQGTISYWRRSATAQFPKPVRELRCGPLFSLREVLVWNARRNWKQRESA